MHGMTDARGVAVGSRLTAGPVHDPQGRAFWLPDLPQLEPRLERAIPRLGDQGSVGEKLARQLKPELGVEWWAMRRDDEPEEGPTAYNQRVGGARKIIETTIRGLTEVIRWTPKSRQKKCLV